MSYGAFTHALEWIWGPDRDGQQDDTAEGEHFWTSWGITQATWDGAVADRLVQGDLEHASKAQCAIIYRARFWNALHCDFMPDPVAFVAFADATLVGTGHVARLIQRIVGAEQDGVIGPNTLAHVHSWNPRVLAGMIVDGDEEYLASIPGAVRYGKGWQRREEALRDAVLAVDRIA